MNNLEKEKGEVLPTSPNMNLDDFTDNLPTIQDTDKSADKQEKSATGKQKKTAGKPRSVIEFIIFEDNTGKASISDVNLFKYLHSNGFRRLPTSTERQADLVKFDGCILQAVNIGFIIDYLKKFILTTSTDHNNAINALIKKSEKFNPKYWLHLEQIEPAKPLDNAGTGFYSFSNCFAEVTADSIRTKPIKEFKGYVFKKDIQDRNFSIDSRKGEFEIFIENTQKDKAGNLNPDRLKSALSGIGYGLHKYFNQSNARALIIQDEQIRRFKTEANGGTGKSLIAKALQIMRPGFYLDCKTADFKNDAFLYDGANPADQTLIYDDVKNNFPLELVYNQLQRPAQINAKHKGKIPFNTVPKYIITSNSIIDTSSQSSKRRSFLLFCGEYYNLERTPFQEFNHNLFDDWTAEEWNLFYNFMLKCLQFYLKNGLIEYEPAGFKTRQIIESFGYDDYCWLTEHIKPTGGTEAQKLDSDLALQSYISYTGKTKTEKKDLTKIVFHYAKLNGFEADHKPTNGARYYTIK